MTFVLVRSSQQLSTRWVQSRPILYEIQVAKNTGNKEKKLDYKKNSCYNFGKILEVWLETSSKKKNIRLKAVTTFIKIKENKMFL